MSLRCGECLLSFETSIVAMRLQAVIPQRLAEATYV